LKRAVGITPNGPFLFHEYRTKEEIAMLIRFTAKHMTEYQGIDGRGGSIALKKNDEAEVSESIARLLLQKYGQDFEIAVESKPDHAPQADKLFRKGPKTRTK